MLQIEEKPQRFRCGNIKTKIMSDLKKIKLTDLVRSEKIDTQALAKIKGGYSVMLLDAILAFVQRKSIPIIVLEVLFAHMALQDKDYIWGKCVQKTCTSSLEIVQL